MRIDQGRIVVSLLNSINLIAYPVINPNPEGNNYIVYNRTSLIPSEVKGREVGMTTSNYDIMIVTDEYGRGLRLAGDVIDTLSEYSDDEVIDISFEGLSETYNELGFIQIVSISILT